MDFYLYCVSALLFYYYSLFLLILFYLHQLEQLSSYFCLFIDPTAAQRYWEHQSESKFLYVLNICVIVVFYILVTVLFLTIYLFSNIIIPFVSFLLITFNCFKSIYSLSIQ